jgi:hypothetical protein
MLSHWDVCTQLPDNYQLDETDGQQLCISNEEYAAVLKKQQQQQKRSRASQQCPDGGFAAAFWKLLLL